jgi:hypothetical protein
MGEGGSALPVFSSLTRLIGGLRCANPPYERCKIQEDGMNQKV